MPFTKYGKLETKSALIVNILLSDKIEGMEFIEPEKNLTDKSTSTNEKGSSGLFPMFIWTNGIDCD